MGQNTKKEEGYFPIGLLFPLIFIMSVLPLITYLMSYESHLDKFDWFTGYITMDDFYLYAKMIWFLIACGMIIFCLIYLFFSLEQKAAWCKNLLPLAIYSGLAFLSACFSKYAYFSFHGIYEQLESIWVLLGYALVVYYGFLVLRSETAVKKLMFWFVIGIAIMAALGLSQVLGHDFFQTLIGQKLMVAGKKDVVKNPLIFNFEKGRAYLSLYNPNYVGYYVAMVVPILIGLTFAAKKIWQRIIYIALALIMMLILFASQSRAGVVAILASLIVMLLCMRKLFIKNWLITVCGIALFSVSFIVVNLLNQNILIDRMKSMLNTEPEYHALKSIETLDSHIAITYNDDILKVSLEENEDGQKTVLLKDSSDNDVESTVQEDGSYLINDERFPFSYSLANDGTFDGIRINIEGMDWYFSNSMKKSDKSYYYCSVKFRYKLMKLTKQEPTLKFLEEHYHFANKRGYLWARTLPLIKKYFFLGSGPDTFLIAFPNNDQVGLYNAGHVDSIITKPHCMYMQIAVQTGVPSLIALLIFFGWYFIDSLKLYWKNSYTQYLPKIGVSVFVSAFGFLILAITNDSCIAVTPVFYSIVGLGLAINHKLKSDAKQSN